MKRILFLTLCMLAFGFGMAQQHHWTPVENFENTMDGIGVVIIDGEEQFRGDIELGVFCGDECRGSVFPEDEVEHWFYYFSMGGVTNETFTFRLYDHALQQEFDVTCENEAVPFVANDFLGDWDAPYEIVFTSNASPTTTNTTSGDWSDPTIWGGAVPDENAVVELGADCTIGENGASTVTVAALTIPDGNALTVEAGSILVVTGDLVCADENGLVIEDGAQVVNGSANVKASYRKEITSYAAKDNGGWYAIASPMNAMPITGSDFVVPEYDLYRYNEPTHEWENYKTGAFTTFENGRGYLYANANTSTPEFEGTLNYSDVMANVTYTSGAGDLKGFNLIGNPFPHAIYKGEGGAIDNANLASGFYTLNNEGAWHVNTYDDAIMPGQGVLVKTTANTNLAIAKTNVVATAESNGAKSNIGRICITVTGSNGEDRTFVYFGQGIGLNKMGGFSDQTPSLWVRNNNIDYAIAHVGNTCESLDLFFHNKVNSEYRLSVSAKGVIFGVLQLVDNVTGEVIDLKQHPDYCFHANGNEVDGRFKLVFRLTTGVEETAETEPFAFVIDRKIVLVGVDESAELQVVDMTGRFVSKNELAPGIYVLRLKNGNETRTQKIVVK